MRPNDEIQPRICRRGEVPKANTSAAAPSWASTLAGKVRSAMEDSVILNIHTVPIVSL